MNGFALVVFVEGAFDCIVRCATAEMAQAWAAGAKHAAHHYRGDGFLAITCSQQMLRAPVGVLKVALDDEIYEEGFDIDRIEREKACEALIRSNSTQFSPFITVVK